MSFRRLLLPALIALSMAACERRGSPPPDHRDPAGDSLLDRLRPERIDADARKFLSIDGLVALVRGHQRAIASVAFSADGQWLASSSWDNTVHVWKLGDEEPKDWSRFDASPSGIAFHPNGKWLAAGSGGTGVYLWDITTEKPERKFVLAGHKKRPFALAFAPNGKLLASGCLQPILRVTKFEDAEPEAWGVLTGEHAPPFAISSLSFSHDNKFLVAGTHLGANGLRIWDVAGSYLEERELPPTRARLVACSPAEPLLAWSGDDDPIHLWRLDGEQPREQLKLPGHQGRGPPPAVKALAFSPTGKALASAGQDRRLRIWDPATGQQVREWHLLDEVRSLAFSPDGRHLATGNDDGSTYVLRLP
jgi:WD40 repeat protein